jgi:hypothetical protein
MSTLYNFYCDESCHLEGDGNDVMLLGAVWCPQENVKEINQRIRSIKQHNGISPFAEMKWSKLSEAKKQAYLELVNYFFDNNVLHYRGLIIVNKNALDHKRFTQTHDEWYYKMYFDMLKMVINPLDRYNIYLDIKDTNSAYKIQKLHEILSNNIYDFSKNIIKKIQTVHSREIQIMQLTDIFTGALSYKARDLSKVNAKVELIELLKSRSGYSLNKSTLYRENKFNIFYLHLEERDNENL